MADRKVVIIADDGRRHVFPAGFDPQRAAAIVRGDEGAPAATATTQPTAQNMPPMPAHELSPSAGLGMPAAGLAAGTLRAAPGIVSMANQAMPGIAKSASRLGKAGAVGTAGAMLYQVGQGDYGGAARTGGAAALASQVPRAARAVERATAAKGLVTRAATGGRFVAGTPPGWLNRLAGGVAKLGERSTLPGLLLGMLTEPGDRPPGETDETTAARQAEFQRQYDEMLAAKYQEMLQASQRVPK